VIECSQPAALALLALLPLLWIGQRRSIAQLSRLQRAACLAVRAILVSLVVLALAGVHVLLPSNRLGVIFVVDASASVSPEAATAARDFARSALRFPGASDAVGVVGFSRRAEVWQPPAEGLSLTVWPALPDTAASDIGSALDLASALFPGGHSRRIVLLSDGNDTEGGALRAAAALGRAGCEVWTVPLRNPFLPEVLVERVSIPEHLKEGEAFDLAANIRSTVATGCKVRLYQSQLLLAEREIALKPGDNSFRQPGLRPDGSFVQFDLELLPADDTLIENNRGSAVASLRGQPRVLIVDGDSDKARPLEKALLAARINAELRGPRGAPRTLEDLQQFDLFILSDLSALNFSREQMELSRRWVQDFGGSFLLAGGENSFGVGGYYRTPIEQMLPVRMEHDDRQELPSVALLVVLDRSGSMSAQSGGATKMALANQGAVMALSVLGPRDYFGVLAVDTRAHVVAPVAKHAAKEPIAQSILSVTAGGGGIYVYSALAESLQLLRDVNARIKHVILFSDAADAEEKRAGEHPDGAQGSGTALELASAMMSAKITTSVVALGAEQDKDTDFLRQLAERGQGRFYLTNDATTLPQIFSTEAMKVTQSSVIEEPTLAVPVGRSPMLAGLDWAGSPLLLGYNSTLPKPTADVLLATESSEPLLATWRFGLGQAAAFTSDIKSRWAGEWLAWPGYAKFWTQVARGLMRQAGPVPFEVTRREIGDELELRVDAVTPDGAFRNRLPITVAARAANGAAQSVRAIQDAPGGYRARIALPKEGATVIHVASPELSEGGIAFAHARSYPREYLTGETQDALLKEIAVAGHGRFDPRPQDVFSRPQQPGALRKDLSNWFLCAALILLPLDVFLRRRSRS
jgi:uncharacterized membrane protein